MNMKNFRSRPTLALVLLAALPLSMQPKTAHGAIVDSNGDRAIEFRDIFLGSIEDQYTDDQKNQLIYLPTTLLSNSLHKATTAEQLMATLAEVEQKVDPLSLYETGRATPAHPYATQKLEDILRASGPQIQDRLTVVIIPGIFGEFIKTRAYEEIFALKHSAFRDFWLSNLATYKNAVTAGKADKAALSDMSYSTQAVTQVHRSIEELVHVSSIDDANGAPLVNVMLMDTKFMSLESLGHIADRAQLFSRRLSKISQILTQNGVSLKNVAFMGYSRGTPIALEMLARAKESPDKNPWLANTRAMISLGGVIFGSDLADEAFNVHGKKNPPASFNQLRILNEFKDKLELIGDRHNIAKLVVANNLRKWSGFIFDMIYATNPPMAVVRSILRFIGNEDKVGWLSQKAAVLLGTQSEAMKLDSNAGIELVTQFAYKAFSLKHPVTHNDPNVKRFQTLAAAVYDGASELSTTARMDWWRQNIVPTQGIKYYAITGTMVEDTGSGFQHELATNRTCYNPDLLDFGMLQGNYRDFKAASGIAVNDSQVAAYKARFWPELNHLLNPEQPELDQSYLGVLGVHHWGLALRVVNAPDPKKVTVPINPFPRRALLKALSTIVVKDYTGKTLE